MDAIISNYLQEFYIRKSIQFKIKKYRIFLIE